MARLPPGFTLFPYTTLFRSTLARDYKERGMAAYAELQGREFASEKDGYAAVRHQEFVGVGYFDEITQIATGGQSSVTAMEGSTEKAQFRKPQKAAAR